MAPVKAGKQGAAGEPEFPDEFEVLRKAVLQLTDLGNNNNKYYAIELHQADDQFRVLTHYGRTDDLDKTPNAGVRESRYYDTLTEAEDGYDSIYAQKTAKSKGYQEVQLSSSKIGSPQARALDGPAPVAVARGPAKPSN